MDIKIYILDIFKLVNLVIVPIFVEESKKEKGLQARIETGKIYDFIISINSNCEKLVFWRNDLIS